MSDGSFVAVTALAASRSHLPTGIFDLYLGVDPRRPDDARVLAFLERALVSPHRGWAHWSDYTLLMDGERGLGGVCACLASLLPAFPFPAPAVAATVAALGWPPSEVNDIMRRMDDFLRHVDDLFIAEDANTWFVQFMAVTPQARGQGHGRAMMEHTLEMARAAGADHAELLTDLGNAVAERLYQRLGFVQVAEYFYHDLPAAHLALLGPGMKRWRLAL